MAEAPRNARLDVEPQTARAHAPVRALRTPQFLVLAGTFFLCCAAHSGPIFHTVSYAMLCGIPALAAASIYSVEGVAGLFGRLIFGVLADRVGVKRVLIGGLALQAVGIYSYIYVTQLTDFYMLAVVLGHGLWRRDAALCGAGPRLFRPPCHGDGAWRSHHDLKYRHGLRPGRRRLAL